MFYKIFVVAVLIVFFVAGGYIFTKGEEGVANNESIIQNSTYISSEVDRKRMQPQENLVEKKTGRKPGQVITPDELYQQRFAPAKLEDELEPTMVEEEVVPEELRKMEEDAKAGVYSDELEPTMADEEVVPEELRKLEEDAKAGIYSYDQAEYDPMPDSPVDNY